jgi:hypothetical protein
MLIYTLLGFVLFRFFLIPNYNRFCDTYCSGVDCHDSMLCSPLPLPTGVVGEEEAAAGGYAGFSYSDSDSDRLLFRDVFDADDHEF